LAPKRINPDQPMTVSNTPQSYGSFARILHWLTALLILTAIPLGLYANALPYDTSEALSAKARVFSLHKTLGIAAFAVALLRIIWALTQPRPTPLHPERRLETVLAETVHWTLYISMLAVPLSGWVHHAATSGFAPILWPFGDDLPFVQKSEGLASTAAALHWLFTKLLAASILLHVAGALKHALIDRDDTLARMIRGQPASETASETAGKPARKPARHTLAPLGIALCIYLAGSGAALTLATPAPPPAATTESAAMPTGPNDLSANWEVTDGDVQFSVRQLGAEVTGHFAQWSADIAFDPAAAAGNRVSVGIDMTSLTLGSVTEQAKGAEFLDVASHPIARFDADIRPDGDNWLAEGTLTIRGMSRPLSLPFTLDLSDEQARMRGATILDRRDFGIGAAYGDEATVGYAVTLSVALNATPIRP
jgi:cytochrome b561/polyisoprenoid-binding protein YceI